MINVIQLPETNDTRQRRGRKEREAYEAEEKRDKAEHRKWLKATKAQRDAERVESKRYCTAWIRLHRVVSSLDWALKLKGVDEVEARFAMMEDVLIASSGYESLDALMAAKAAAEEAEEEATA